MSVVRTSAPAVILTQTPSAENVNVFSSLLYNMSMVDAPSDGTVL